MCEINALFGDQIAVDCARPRSPQGRGYVSHLYSFMGISRAR